MKLKLWELLVWLIFLITIAWLCVVAAGFENISSFLDDHISAVAVIIASVATIVAIFLGYHTAHVSAVLRVAEFRQNWINGLRDDLAKFHAIGINPDENPMRIREFYEVGTRIELRMNPEDPHYEALQAAMHAYLNSANGDVFEKYGNNAEFIEISQRILKREWDRLKDDVRARNI